MKTYVLAITLLILATACRKDPLEGIERATGEGIVGKWLLVERGDWNGKPYTHKIPLNPPQTLRFQKDSTVVATGVELRNYASVRSYTINREYLYLHRSPADTSAQYGGNRHGYRVRNDTLRLDPICQEGCSLWFIRIQ
ncbi:hypothetical protein BWI97_06420 [Siphonobacter sp. BAB-5405]|uniref:hypothetical protein n=1 Tax=Siphonobacter sp. BAB-5405 TaxID=1864825 RepID=UPI000C7F8007|nr:hypothetical protein [Siphonobacter sp. BAB-5405]PMD97267.1 hypothetical protein BWI97_06420 [Siphonobacter sp. BAB-5405]